MKATTGRGSDPSGRGLSGWFFVVSTAAVVAWLIFQLCWMPGHIFGATRFILGDQGSYLYAIGRWGAGERLYHDFAWQYGPLALAWYRASAAIGGNSPLTLVLATSITFAVAWVIVAGLVVRFAGWRQGGLLAVAGLLPVMSALGTFALNSAHGAIEMLLLAGCAWLLAAEENARWRPWLLGLFAGLLHWVRFGPQVPALAATIAIVGWQSWPQTGSARAWFRLVAGFSWRLLAAYFLTIAPLVIWICVTLPWPGARDQLWPSYMVASYAATFPNRWPQIESLGLFAVIWLPGLVGVGLMLARIARGWRRGASPAAPSRSGAVAGLIFLPLFYVICFGVIFRSDNPMIGCLWMTWPGLALVVGVKSKFWRGVWLTLVIPAVAGNLVINWALVKEEEAWGARPMVMPNGQQLWFHGDEARRFGALQAALGPAPESRRLAVLLAGGGIHHFFGTQRVGRHWWFLPEFVRPWEEKPVAQALLQSEMILVADRDEMSKTRAPNGTLTLWLPLPRAVSLQVLPQVRNPRHLEGIGLLLDVQP